MSWPLASHFSLMLQNPQIAFRDAELRGCRIEKDERNQPRPWSGAFAVVYKGTSADGRRSFAIRAFTTESPERRERYDLISDYLKTRRLECLVDFEYRDRSIRSAGDGKWYPLILMDWVQGETLFKWVRGRSLTGDTAALSAAAERWVVLVRELANAGIAHGDLQHGNVMVTEAGELKLVDYDCMCVPALASRRNLEVGVEPYQHPARNEHSLLSATMDRFSSLVIYVALRALAADPFLWTRYVEDFAYDKLLFRREDFRVPDASPLYRDLLQSPDEQVRAMTEKLFSLTRVPIDQVPPLSELADSFGQIEQLLRAEQWDEAVHLLNRRGQFRDAPQRLKPLIQRAYEHVCRQKAWDSYQKIALAETEACDRRLAAAWNEELFAGFAPAEAQRERLNTARRRIAALRTLHQLAQESPAPSRFEHEAKLVMAAKGFPKDYQYVLHERVQQARQCVSALRELALAIRNGSTEAAINTAWRRVVRTKCQGMIRAAWKPRIVLAQKRLPLLEGLKRIPSDLPRDQLDQRLLDVWNDDLLKDCPEADAWRDSYQQAALRREAVQRLEHAVHACDEVEIERLMREPCLVDYPIPVAWMATVRVARERMVRTEQLTSALENGQRSAFLGLFDARVIRRYPERFLGWQETLDQWIQSEVLPTENMGLRPALGRASLVRDEREPGVYRACWTWPQQRFSDECLLAICSEPPGVGPDPRNLSVLHRISMDRTSWESGGGTRSIHVVPEWQGSYVVVWATIDVGFRTYCSHPLVLGQIEDISNRQADNVRGWHVFFRRGRRASPAAQDERAQAGPTAPEDEHG